MEKLITQVKVRDDIEPDFYYCDDATIKIDDLVLVKIDNSIDYGKIIKEPSNVQQLSSELNINSIIRKCNENDLNIIKELHDKEIKASAVVNEQIKKLNLKMNVIYVHFNFDDSQLYINYIAPSRVDFRKLLINLKTIYKQRIKLMQIFNKKSSQNNLKKNENKDHKENNADKKDVNTEKNKVTKNKENAFDECVKLGGLGICGREFCCRTFLKKPYKGDLKECLEIQHIQMYNPKNYGPCGKIYCCYKYEADTYREESKLYPKINSTITLNNVKHKVLDFNIFNHKIKTSFINDDHETEFLYITLEDYLKIINNEKKS